MPTIYTYKAKFEQPVHVIFQCEYCNHNFTVTGRITAEIKTEKWVTARSGEAQAELLARGESALEKTRTFLEQSLGRGAFTQRFVDEGGSIKFEGGNTCPECGYHQQIAIPPKANLRSMIAGFGCGGILLLFFAIGLVSLIQGTATDLAYVFLIGIPLLAAFIIAFFALRKPNRAFMKKHGLKKQDLPQPRKPEINYGQIKTA